MSKSLELAQELEQTKLKLSEVMELEECNSKYIKHLEEELARLKSRNLIQRILNKM